MITKAFGQSQMREFAKNCDIDLARQIKLDEADIVIRDQYHQRLINEAPQKNPRTGEHFMYDEAMENSRWDPDGIGGENYVVPKGENTSFHKRLTLQAPQQQVSKQNTLKLSNSFVQQNSNSRQASK